MYCSKCNETCSDNIYCNNCERPYCLNCVRQSFMSIMFKVYEHGCFVRACFKCMNASQYTSNIDIIMRMSREGLFDTCESV